MPPSADRAALARPLFLAAVGALMLMSGFEALKQTFFPHISIWQSHVATICFTSLLAVLSVFFVGRRLVALNRKLQDDIAFRDNIANALEQSEARYRILFERNQAGIFRTTVDGRFLDCNEAFARMFGYEREELLQLPAHVLYVGGTAERAERFAEFLKTRQMTDLEMAYQHKNGSIVWAIQNVHLLKDKDGNDVSQGAVVDVTARHMLQERLRQAEKMEAVGRLAGGIAHDFNNLLTVIIGYSSQLRESPAVPEEARDDIAKIKEAAAQAASLTRQLLAFGRKQMLAVRVLNLNTLVAGTANLLERLIGENIQLVSRTASDLKQVKADPSQMEQVIMNLALNARDAMPGGGQLTLETANVHLDEEYATTRVGVAPGPYVMLAVSDTGQGMSPETQSQIFEPFFTTKEMGRGTGLGLSTVYGIVKQSGGHVAVYSELGHGTTFKIYLPQTEAAAVPVSVVDSAAPAARPTETILVVEDDPRVRRVVEKTLTLAGYTVLVAEGAKSALCLAEQHATTIRLVLTDAVMPEMNGREVVCQIAARNPAIKVIFMSGYTENIIHQQGVLQPGTHFLQKPFTSAALTMKVREVLDGQARTS